MDHIIATVEPKSQIERLGIFSRQVTRYRGLGTTGIPAQAACRVGT